MPKPNQSIITYMKKFAAIYNDVPAEERREFGEYLKSLNRLHGKIESVYGSGRNDEPKELSENDLDGLRQGYAEIFEAGAVFERYMSGRDPAAGKSGELLENITKLNVLLQQEFQSLSASHQAAGVTLSDAFDNARHITIDISGQTASVAAGNASSREAVSYSDRSGRKIKGFFTENKKFDRDGMIQAKRDELLAAHPEYLDAFWAFEQYDKTSGSPDLEQLTRARTYLTMATLGRVDYKDVFREKLSAALEQDEDYVGNDEKRNEYLNSIMKDTAFTTVFLEYMDYCANAYNADNVQFKEDAANIQTHDNIADRNVAMTRVADLLGMPNLIARASKAEIVSENGSRQGVFMEFAEGSDIRRCTAEDPLCQVDESGLNEVSFKKDLADMQILDYICGNIDRHSQNMFYKVGEKDGKKVITGVVGIDNDLSFGAINPDSNGSVMRLPPLNSISVINKATADRLEKLTPDMLRTALSGLSITDAELDCACARLANVKNAVTAGSIRVVTDAEWEELSTASLGDKFKSYFKTATEVPKDVKSNLNDRTLSAQEWQTVVDQYPELEKDDSFTMADGELANEYTVSVIDANRKALASLNDRLNEVNSGFFISSSAFDAVKDSLRKVAKLTDGASPEMPEKDRKAISEAYDELKNNAKKYLTKKADEAKEHELNQRSLDRVEFVEKLSTFVDTRIDSAAAFEEEAAQNSAAKKAVFEPSDNADKKREALSSFRKALDTTALDEQTKEKLFALETGIIEAREENARTAEAQGTEKSCCRAVGLFLVENSLRKAIGNMQPGQTELPKIAEKMLGKSAEELFAESARSVAELPGALAKLRAMPASEKDALISAAASTARVQQTVSVVISAPRGVQSDAPGYENTVERQSSDDAISSGQSPEFSSNI